MLLPVALIAKVPIRRFVQAVAEPVSIAFATTSSEAALPRAMEAMEKLGVPRQIVAFVMPSAAFVIGLWITILFALFTMWPLIGDGSIRLVLAISAILVLAFNTAAIVAMLRHYRSDKSFIYGLDIKHLDEMRRRKR